MLLVESLALYLAGLSFFFAGVTGISENLRLLSGRGFRVLLGRATDHPVLAALLGVAMGALTQSASVVALIVSGMVASGMLALRRALIVVACASIGTSLLVFIAALDLRLPVLFLIGISGLVLGFKVWANWKPGFASLLSVGLLLFGLEMMKQAFNPLSSSAGAINVGKFFEVWPNAAFFAGTALRSVIHSSSSVAAITITVSQGARLGVLPAMMSTAGVGVGSAIATYVLSSRTKGVPRQIALHQAFTNLCAGLIVAGLLTLERVTGLPLLIGLAHRLHFATSQCVAVTYLLLNFATVGVALVTLGFAPEWLDALSPPSAEEDLSIPKYVQPEALGAPESALELLAMEQMRVMHALGQYMQFARGGSDIKIGALHEAAKRLGVEIRAFLAALVEQPIGTRLAARGLSFQRKEETLSALEGNVYLFAETVGKRKSSAALASALVESLDLIVSTAVDALGSGSKDDIDMVIRLTEDRGPMMEELREGVRFNEGHAVEDVSALHYATTLFERNVWLLRQLALWMREDAAAEARLSLGEPR